MKKLFTLLTLLMLLGGGNLWAETGTEEATKTGTSNQAITGTSYSIAGTYIAGSGADYASGMANAGVKFRTGSDGARLVFAVNTGYTITDFKLYGVSNYALKEGANEPCIAVTKVEVDGTETTFTGTGNFPAKGSTTAGSILLSGINAEETIAIYFDNSNAAGTQINGYYEITWSTVDAAQPLQTTVSPSSAYVAVGSTKQLTGSFTGGTFTGEWVSDNESVATVSEAGVVTGVAEGTANITYQWTENQSLDAYKATATVTVVEAFDAESLAAVKTYDFANLGSTTLTIESTAEGNIWNKENSKNNPVFRCTNEGLTSIAIQAVLSSSKGWTINDNGLYEGSSAGRCAAICDVKAGQYIEFYHNSGTSFYTKNDGEDDGAKKIPLVEESNHHVYKVLEDGMVGFELTKGKYVTKVVIYEKKSGTATNLTFSAATATATLGEAFVAPTLTKDPADLAGVVFSSSNTAVATVDAETGEVTLIAGGVTIITATYEETEDFWGATASYELTVVDPSATGYDGEGVTITWPFDTGADGQTAAIVYGTATEKLFKNTSISIGSNFSFSGVQAATITAGDETTVNMSKLKATAKEGSAANSNAITFTVTPKTGMTFTPTRVSFRAARLGTNGGAMTISWIDGTNSVQLGTAKGATNGTDPGRPGQTDPGSTAYSYDLTSKATATTDECGLKINLYSLDANKEYSFSDIVIEGTLSGSVSAVNTYTITAQVGIDGAGTVTPAEVVVDEGDGTTLTATANDGYLFQNWTRGSDSETLTQNPLTLTDVNANETYTANFKKLFKIAYNTTGEGVLKGTTTNVLTNEYASAADKFTAPKNLYLTKAGQTFQNWTDGVNSYVPGTEYTLTSDITLAPVFAENTKSLNRSMAETTVTWNFKSTEVYFNSQGNTQYYVKQATVEGETVDFAMFCDATSGKLNNDGRTDNWVQANGGTVLTIPAVSGMTVVINSYNEFGRDGQTKTTIAGSEDYTLSNSNKTATYTYTGTANTIDIAVGGDISYLSSVAVTYPKTHTYVDVTSVGYRTFASGSALDFTGGVEGLTAYRATVSGDNVSFVEIDGAVPAGEGMLLKADEGRYYIPLATGTPDAIENAFVGVTTATEVEAGIFVLMNEDGVVGFYKTKNAFTVGANTAYLPATTTARNFIGLDDETTGISAALMNGERVNGEVYNLNGQRVAQPAKGLYIVNGKKVIINK